MVYHLGVDSFAAIGAGGRVENCVRERLGIYADRCAQCKELDEKTWSDPEVKAWIAKNVVPIRIDTDAKRKDLAPVLKMQSYPSVILLDGEGKEVRRILGFHEPEGMLSFFNGKE